MGDGIQGCSPGNSYRGIVLDHVRNHLSGDPGHLVQAVNLGRP